MNSLTILGLESRKLNIFKDERGAVMQFFKKNTFKLKECSEVYFSVTNEGIVKGWKYHKEIWQHLSVINGAIELVVFDNRENSETKGHINRLVLDDGERYCLLIMPPGLWYSFKGLGSKDSIIANVITAEHSPEESITVPLNDLTMPQCW